MKIPVCFLLLLITGCQTLTDTPSCIETENMTNRSIDTTGLFPTLRSGVSVRQFYEKRENKVFWLSEHGLGSSADSLIKFIRQTPLLGLTPDDYHWPRIVSLLSDTLSTNRFIQLDLLLTDAWLTLYTHLQKGRLDPSTLERLNTASVTYPEAVASLADISDGSAIRLLRSLEPKAHQYRELKTQLRSFLQQAVRDTLQYEKVLKLALNIERWRWRKQSPDRYVTVNIPAFTLRVFERDSLWLETPVIVGKRNTPTPIMESVIRSFIIYPYWHVPNSISTKEILPHLQNDAMYLRKNNFDVLDRDGQILRSDTIQWGRYTPSYFPFILRQREGSENTMGIIKFVFANNYGVYLHDTNGKRLFKRSERDLSHGCVRVSNAVALAHYLVHDDDIYVSPEDLDQYLSLQQRLKIDLRKPAPLKLEYFTAEVKDGIALFYDDIYKKDSVMLANLFPSKQKQAVFGFMPSR